VIDFREYLTQECNMSFTTLTDDEEKELHRLKPLLLAGSAALSESKGLSGQMRDAFRSNDDRLS
jgi:hypothetical protein